METATQSTQSASESSGRDMLPNINTASWDKPEVKTDATMLQNDVDKKDEVPGENKEEKKEEPAVVTVVEKNNTEETPEVSDEDAEELLRIIGSTEPEKKEEKKSEQIPDDYKAYKERAEYLESLEKDPVLKSIIEARQNGEDIEQVIAKIKPVNYDKKTDTEIFEEYVSKMNLSPEELEAEREIFQSKSAIEKRAMVNPLRAELKKEQETRVSQFNQPNPQKEAEKQFWNQKGQEAFEELNNVFTKIQESKKYKFTSLSPEMVEELKQACFNEDTKNIPLKKDKAGKVIGYDIPELVRRVFLRDHESVYVKSITDKAQTKAVRDVYDKKFRPNANKSANVSAPVVEQSIDDALKMVNDERWSRKPTQKTN